PSDTNCDNPDTCDGAGTCSPNHEPATVVCRAVLSGEDCDQAELCDGAGACPADGLKPSGTVRRAAPDECDVAESCDGSTKLCPGDAKEPSGTPCTADGNACTLDACDGASVTYQQRGRV